MPVTIKSLPYRNVVPVDLHKTWIRTTTHRLRLPAANVLYPPDRNARFKLDGLWIRPVLIPAHHEDLLTGIGP